MAEPHGYTIFCDDIREEVGNKISYMGRYISELNVTGTRTPIGLALPKFCAAVQLVVPRELTFLRARIVIMLDVEGEDPKTLAELAMDFPRDVQNINGDVIAIGANFVLSPLALTSDCYLRARGYLDELEVKAGSLRVNLTEVSAPKQD